MPTSQAVQLLSEGEARSRKAMAHRALALRDGLRHSESRSRAISEAQRRHKLEVQVMTKLHSEQLHSERSALDQHYGNQMKAVQAVSGNKYSDDCMGYCTCISDASGCQLRHLR